MGEPEQLNEVLNKVRDLHDLLHGDADRPGMTHRLRTMEDAIFGVAGAWGIKHKMEILWRGHIWLLCTMSAIAGWIGRSYLDRIVGP